MTLAGMPAATTASRAASFLLRSPPACTITRLLCSSRRIFHFSSVACRTGRSEYSVMSTSARKDKERLLQHLLVKDDQLQLLLDLQRKLMQEEVGLGDLATEYSICPSKADGGMLGWVKKGQTVEEFEEAAFTAPLNKVVRVKTKLGWHLIQAISERDAVILEDIDVGELYSRLQEAEYASNAQFIDVRELQEISIASIQGFKAYPLSRFAEWSSQIISDLDPSKDTYVLCHHGVRSLQAAKWLQTQGFTRLYNVAGGIHQYSLKVDQNVPTY